MEVGLASVEVVEAAMEATSIFVASVEVTVEAN